LASVEKGHERVQQSRGWPLAPLDYLIGARIELAF